MSIDRDDIESGDAEFARRIAGPLRAPESLDASFEARLMARVEAAARAGEGPRADAGIARRAPAGVRPAAGWRRLTSARTIRVSPLAGLALAAGFAGIVALGTAGVVRARVAPPAPAPVVAAVPAPVAPAAHDTVRVVQFVLVAPTARQVAVVGDFNDWQRGATPLRRVSTGNLWSVEVPLAPGRHQYAFIVDGSRWVLDPTAPTAVEDDFGTPNSVVTVGESAS